MFKWPLLFIEFHILIMLNDITALFPLFIVCNKFTTEGTKWWAVATMRTIMCVLVMTSSHHDTWPRETQGVLEPFLVCRCTADNSNKENNAQDESSFHFTSVSRSFWSFLRQAEGFVVSRNRGPRWNLNLGSSCRAMLTITITMRRKHVTTLWTVSQNYRLSYNVSMVLSSLGIAL